MTITLLAAPRIVRFPAIVAPADNARRNWVPDPAWINTGWKSATNGTFEINWLMTTAAVMIAGTLESAWESTKDWINPVEKTLAIRTNIAAKNTSVRQSIARRIFCLFGEKSGIGAAPMTAIAVRGSPIPGKTNVVTMVSPTRAIIMISEIFERKAS